MLLVGDIHITKKVKNRLCEEIQEYILSHPDENSIVFLGDMVYHFTYDRSSLLHLYSLLLKLYDMGKQLYVLAGNHDRISEHYVFEEGQKAFSYARGTGSIQFITKPTLITIEGQDCLFFPYTLFSEEDLPVGEKKGSGVFQELLTSDHQKEQWSGRANLCLEGLISKRKSSEKKNSSTLCVFHHRYHVGTKFPGQFATFSYKSPGLSQDFFDMEDVFLISGHLHKPFSYKNYLCVGSVWSTSPLEVNQVKFLFQFLPKEKTVLATAIHINPYLHMHIEEGSQLDLDAVKEYRESILHASSESFSSDKRHVMCEISPTKYEYSDVSLTCITDMSYDQFIEQASPDIFSCMKDVTIKQKTRSLPQIIDLLDTGSKELGERVSDRKILLKEYIIQKYQKKADHYFDELDVLGITLV